MASNGYRKVFTRIKNTISDPIKLKYFLQTYKKDLRQWVNQTLIH